MVEKLSTGSGVPEVWSFACTACGRCCNSPPQLSLPELFHHQHLFIGCLAIRRHMPVTPQTRAAVGGQRFDDEDCAASAELFRSLLFKATAPGHGGEYIALSTLGFDYPSRPRCPALAEDQRCSIHDDRLPAQCAAVPMDPLVPDRLQHVVLAGRATAHNFIAADCITAGRRDGAAALTADGAITDASFRDAVHRRRADLAADKAWWGNAVFAALRRELFDSPAALARVPFDGFFEVSLVPVLATVAGRSDHARRRCLSYLEAQLQLIDDTVKRAVARRSADDKPTSRQLRAWGQSYRVLRNTLAAGNSAAPDDPDLRAWLG